MGKVGVEVRVKSIRLRFTLDSEPMRPTLRDDNGSPMRPTPANIKYAGRLANEIRQKMELGIFSMVEYFPDDGQAGSLTLSRQLDTWFATQRLAPSTLAAYGSAINFWKNAIYASDDVRVLGDKPLRAVTITDLRTALALRPKLSGKTVNNYVSVLHEAFDLALDENLVEKNVAADIARAKWQREPPDPFTREEAEVIIADLLTHYPESVGNMVEWWFFTGVRTGEAFGLRWGNVDLASSNMLIAESIVMGEQRDSTKTGVARNVMLNSRAAAAVQRQRAHSQMAGAHVWLNPYHGGGWTDERAFRRSYWEPTLKRLGIRYRRPYNMRHSYATMLLMAGATPAWCAKQLGHSVEIFLRTYSKWIDGDQNNRELAGLEGWLGSSNPLKGQAQ